MNNKIKPPRWMDWLIGKLAPEHLAEEIKGDLFEFFLSDLKSKSIKAAKQKYIINALGFLFKQFFWKRSSQHSTLSPMMNSYFKMAKRSLLAYKGTTIINILGLVIGIAASLVILTVIRFELSFDSFHSDADRIYRIVRLNGDLAEYRTGVSYPVPFALRDEVPLFENITMVEYEGGVNVDILNDAGTSIKMFKEDNGVAMVDGAFFNVFDFRNTSFKWISGDPKLAFNEPFNVVLTQSLARKYFDTEQALGKVLKFEKRIDCKVTGVIADLPNNTDFPFTMLISYSTLNKLNERAFSDWNSVNDENQGYVKLKPGITQTEAEDQIEKVHRAHTSKDLYEGRHYRLQPISEMHNDARYGNYNGRTISKETITALILIGIFLLVTACINYINLATAQSSLRAKEIGLRKVMGSNRNNLVYQFLIETFVVVFIAGILALGLSELLLIRFHSLLNLKLTHYYFSEGFILLSTLAVIVFISLLAGFYPSLVISRFSPVVALKNKFSTETFAGLNLRKVLVVFQFTLTQILVVGTFIVVSQMNFFRKADMGFNPEAILTARVGNNKPSSLKVLEDQLRAQSFVKNVSFSYTLPSGLNRNRNYRDIGKLESPDNEYQVYEYDAVNPAFIEVYGIKILAGRNLEYGDTVGNILINKTLAKNFGWLSPEDAISQGLKANGQKYTVVGVFDDFYSNSLKEGVDNMLIEYKPIALWNASIKLNIQKGKSPMEAVLAIEKIWKENFPDQIFSYQFFDENIEAFYRQEEKYAQLFQLFSITFLLIGCLGLYGLVTFMVNRKGKEVAIRKVLGASINNILILFSKDYVILILISFVLAVPVAYYAVSIWLSNFAQQIELSWWRFTLPGILVLTIALIVVTSKSLRSANANPVEKLKED